jgi:hypothetical protein
MRDNYIAVIDTLILFVVSAETYFTWQYMAHNHKQRIRRHVSRLLKSMGIGLI